MASDAQWDERLAKLRGRLREVDPDLLDAIDAEERGERRLAEEQRARLDAFLTGVGYVVSGRRVDPRLVRVYRYERGGTSDDDVATAGGA